MVFRQCVIEARLQEKIVIDSAGTRDYHIGESPDKRAQQAARRRGYDLSRLRGRQVQTRDFVEADFIVAVDEVNLNLLKRNCPPQHEHKLLLLMDFSTKHDTRNIPDPFYGGPQGFEQVLDMIEDAALGLLRHVRDRLPD